MEQSSESCNPFLSLLDFARIMAAEERRRGQQLGI
jgi:hypothetical protein